MSHGRIRSIALWAASVALLITGAMDGVHAWWLTASAVTALGATVSSLSGALRANTLLLVQTLALFHGDRPTESPLGKHAAGMMWADGSSPFSIDGSSSPSPDGSSPSSSKGDGDRPPPDSQHR
jgi:hypothetical protein